MVLPDHLHVNLPERLAALRVFRKVLDVEGRGGTGLRRSLHADAVTPFIVLCYAADLASGVGKVPCAALEGHLFEGEREGVPVDGPVAWVPAATQEKNSKTR